MPESVNSIANHSALEPTSPNANQQEKGLVDRRNLSTRFLMNLIASRVIKVLQDYDEFLDKERIETQKDSMKTHEKVAWWIGISSFAELAGILGTIAFGAIHAATPDKYKKSCQIFSPMTQNLVGAGNSQIRKQQELAQSLLQKQESFSRHIDKTTSHVNELISRAAQLDTRS